MKWGGRGDLGVGLTSSSFIRCHPNCYFLGMFQELKQNCKLGNFELVVISGTMDVAQILGYAAFDELSKASMIAKFTTPNLENLSHSECFNLFHKIEACRAKLIIHLIKSTSLFQSNMEAIIFEYVEKKPIEKKVKENGELIIEKFGEIWKKIVEDFQTEQCFVDYKLFYDQYRHSIVHFKQEKNESKKSESNDTIERFLKLEFADIHKGIKAGWDVYRHLSNKVGKEHDANSWEMMCEICDVPSSISEIEYPNLNALKSEIWQTWERLRSSTDPL